MHDKIVFQDTDGVLNNIRTIAELGGADIDRTCLLEFARIIRSTEAKIVISSAWRLDNSLMLVLQQKLAEVGIAKEVIGRTVDLSGPRYPCQYRHMEIDQWLKENPTKKFAILDDEDTAGWGNESSFFKTTMRHGLTAEIADKAIAHLNG